MKIMTTSKRQVLNIGCGSKMISVHLDIFPKTDWDEIRLDIDPGVEPDIVNSILDMNAVQTDSMDAVYSAHNLEHLYELDVPVCLAEIQRVLKPDGFAVIGVPNIIAAAKAIIETDDPATPLYSTAQITVAAKDMLWGYGPWLSANPFMAHKTGFTETSLNRLLLAAGFYQVIMRSDALNLIATVLKTAQSESRLPAVLKVPSISSQPS